ncbi:MAG: hypothetical protein EPN21_08830 [Methylococcaceae bacterium]|nr:MAG: hypothetical protein EPN21_08830 [Methylococcaceae bacterium]
MSVVFALSEAIRTGEILTVIYAAGSQPGRKRQIHPVSLQQDEVLARCIASGLTKSYQIALLDVVAHDHPAPAYKQPKRTDKPSVNFDSGYADGWVFLVPTAFRDALDIRLTTRIDKEKTQALRLKQLAGLGFDSFEDVDSKMPDKKFRKEIRKEVNGYKIMEQVWTEGVPPTYAFTRGDMLHHRDGLHAVQVVAPGYAQVTDNEPPLSRAAMDCVYLKRTFPGAGLGVTLYGNPDGDGYQNLYTLLCDQNGFVEWLRGGIDGL